MKYHGRETFKSFLFEFDRTRRKGELAEAKEVEVSSPMGR